MEFADDASESLPLPRSLEDFHPTFEAPAVDPHALGNANLPFRTSFSLDDVEPYARMIYAESRGLKDGWPVVADAALNRVGTRGFPDNLRDVLFQKTAGGAYQFDGVGNPHFNDDPNNMAPDDRVAWDRINDFAKSRIEGAINGQIPYAPR